MFNINSLFQTIDKKALNFKTENFSIEEDYSIGKQVVEVLKSFKVFVEHIETEVGPVITSIYVKPKLGVRIADVEVLEDDLCIALGADRLKVQIAPEKKAIAIEIPTSPRKKIPFGNILYSDTSNKILPATLGIDTRGNPINIDIADTPHLLIAGQTGSGKSVCLNAIITSLALNATPFDLQFLLIDPKHVEFSLYNDLPNLIGGHVINEIDKAMQSLQWLIQEMERRNLILAKSKCRKLSDFKQKLMTGDIAEIPKELADNIPYIVAVIDEYADLMMRSEKELTECIMKLAQKARNVGIHLILATQRPSSKILTGDIKANIPTRIALKVASSVDSKTIIDYGGAEKLLGKGDMILKNSDGKEKRIHGCFLSDDEIEKSVAYLKEFFKDNVFRFNQPNVFDTPFEQYEKEVSQHGVLGLFTGTCSSMLNQLKTKNLNFISAQEQIYKILSKKFNLVIDDNFSDLVLNFKNTDFTRIITWGFFDYETDNGELPFAEKIIEAAFSDEESPEYKLIEACIKEDQFEWLSKMLLDKAIHKKNIHFITNNPKILESSIDDFLECDDEDIQDIIIELAENNVQPAKEIIYQTTTPSYKYCEALAKWSRNGDTKAIESFFDYNDDEDEATKDDFIASDFMNEIENDYIDQIVQNNGNKAKSTIYQMIKEGFFSCGIKKYIDQWAKEDDIKAKEIVYQKPESFPDTIKELSDKNDEKAINIIYLNAKSNSFFSKIITTWAENGNVNAIDYIYQTAENTEDLFKYYDTIKNWANNGSKRAKELIYSKPTIFKKLIKEWAMQNDEDAIDCIFQYPSSFPDLITEWARSNNEKAINCIFQQEEIELYTYNDFIETWANEGNEKAKDFIYNNPSRFNDLIKEWAQQDDEKAIACVFQQAESRPYTYENLIETWANEGNEKAKDFIYEHSCNFDCLIKEWAMQHDEKAIACVFQQAESLPYTYTYKNLIETWANEGNEKAKDFIYNNPSRFNDLIKGWAQQDDEKAKNAIYQITRDAFIEHPYHFIRDNTHKYGIQLITENAQNDDHFAKEIIYQMAEEHFFNLPDSFTALLEKWAEEDDDYAKKLIYQYPENFTKIIEKWANEKDEKAIDRVYANPSSFSKIIEKWWLNSDNDFNEEYIYQNSYAFPKLIAEWVEEGDEKAIKAVYQNPETFTELIGEWADGGDPKTIEIICSHPDIFKGLIEEWAEFGNKRAKECIHKMIETDFFNMPKELIELCANNSLNLFYRKDQEKANEYIYEHPDDFIELIDFWANYCEDGVAAKIIYDNKWYTTDEIDLWRHRLCDFDLKEDDFKDALSNDEYRKNRAFPYIVQYAKDGDDIAKKIIVEQYSDMSFEQFKKLYPNILEWGEENENARKIYCERFDTFWDWYADHESLSRIFDWAIKGDSNALEFISSHIRDFDGFVKDYLMKKANR